MKAFIFQVMDGGGKKGLLDCYIKLLRLEMDHSYPNGTAQLLRYQFRHGFKQSGFRGGVIGQEQERAPAVVGHRIRRTRRKRPGCFGLYFFGGVNGDAGLRAQMDGEILIVEGRQQLSGQQFFFGGVCILIEQPVQHAFRAGRAGDCVDALKDLNDDVLKHNKIVHEEERKVFVVGIADNRLMDGQAKDVFDNQAAALLGNQIFNGIHNLERIILCKKQGRQSQRIGFEVGIKEFFVQLRVQLVVQHTAAAYRSGQAVPAGQQAQSFEIIKAQQLIHTDIHRAPPCLLEQNF